MNSLLTGPGVERTRKAFTLVELLVVIGVIAVLIAILLPAIQGAREAAFRTKCLANVRNLLIATAMYKNDWHGFGPPNAEQDSFQDGKSGWATGYPTSPNSPFVWAQYPVTLSRYLGFNVTDDPNPAYAGRSIPFIAADSKAAQLFFGQACPSNMRVYGSENIVAPGGEVRGWAYTANDRILDPAYKIRAPIKDSRWYRLTSFKGGNQEVVLFWESEWRFRTSTILVTSIAQKRHRGKGMNVGFVGGHAEWVSYDASRKVWSRSLLMDPVKARAAQ